MGLFDELAKSLSDTFGRGKTAADIRLRQAKERANKGDFDSALRLLSEIRYTAEGYSDSVRLTRADVFQKQGRYLVSLDSYQEALSAFEAENRLLGKSSAYPLAEVCWEITRARKTDSEVIRFLNRLLRVETDAAHVFAAESWDFNACICHLAMLIKKHRLTQSDNVIERAFRIHCSHGGQHMRNGCFKEALVELEAAKYLKADDPRLLDDLAKVQFRLGQISCLKTLELLVSMIPASIPYHMKLAKAYFAFEQYDKVLKAVDRVLKQEANHVDAMRLRAKTLLATGSTREAYSFLVTHDGASEIPEYPLLCLATGLIGQQPVDMHLAEQLPHDDISMFVKGIVALQLADYPAAARSLDGISSFEPYVRFHRGLALLQLGQFSYAEADLKWAGKHRGLMAPASDTLAYLYRLHGDAKKTLETLDCIPNELRQTYDFSTKQVAPKLVLLRRWALGIDTLDSETYSLYPELKKDGVIVPEDLEVAVLARRVVHKFLKADYGRKLKSLADKIDHSLGDDPVLQYIRAYVEGVENPENGLKAIERMKGSPVLGNLLIRAKVEFLWRTGRLRDAASVAASLGYEQTKIIGSSNTAMLNFALGRVDETTIMLGLGDATQGFQENDAADVLRALATIIKWRKTTSFISEDNYQNLSPVPKQVFRFLDRGANRLVHEPVTILRILSSQLPAPLFHSLLAHWLSAPSDSAPSTIRREIADFVSVNILKNSTRSKLSSDQNQLLEEALSVGTSAETASAIWLRRAGQAYEAGDFVLAKNALDEAKNPGVLEARVYHGLALAYGACRDWNGALSAWNMTIGIWAKDSSLSARPHLMKAIHMRAADVAKMGSNWRQASEHWEAVLSLSPNDPGVLEPLIMALTNAEDYPKARKFSNMWMTVEPDNIHAAVVATRLAFQSGEFEETLERLAELRKVHPDHPEVVELYFAMKNLFFEWSKQAVDERKWEMALSVLSILEEQFSDSQEDIAIFNAQKAEVLVSVGFEKKSPQMLLHALDMYEKASNLTRNSEMWTALQDAIRRTKQLWAEQIYNECVDVFNATRKALADTMQALDQIEPSRVNWKETRRLFEAIKADFLTVRQSLSEIADVAKQSEDADFRKIYRQFMADVNEVIQYVDGVIKRMRAF